MPVNLDLRCQRQEIIVDGAFLHLLGDDVAVALHGIQRALGHIERGPGRIHLDLRADAALLQFDGAVIVRPHLVSLRSGLSSAVCSCSGDRFEIVAHGRIERDLGVVRHALAAGEEALIAAEFGMTPSARSRVAGGFPGLAKFHGLACRIGSGRAWWHIGIG
jgi:hypothetical protein